MFQFKSVVDKVLTERRKAQLAQRPLTINEFVGALSTSFCVYSQEYIKYWQVISIYLVLSFQPLNDDINYIKEKREKMRAPPEDDTKKKGKKGGEKKKKKQI